MENLSGFVNTRFARRYCVVLLYPVLPLVLVVSFLFVGVPELFFTLAREAWRRCRIANEWAQRIWRM